MNVCWFHGLALIRSRFDAGVTCIVFVLSRSKQPADEGILPQNGRFEGQGAGLCPCSFGSCHSFLRSIKDSAAFLSDWLDLVRLCPLEEAVWHRPIQIRVR